MSSYNISVEDEILVDTVLGEVSRSIISVISFPKVQRIVTAKLGRKIYVWDLTNNESTKALVLNSRGPVVHLVKLDDERFISFGFGSHVQVFSVFKNTSLREIDGGWFYSNSGLKISKNRVLFSVRNTPKWDLEMIYIPNSFEKQSDDPKLLKKLNCHSWDLSPQRTMMISSPVHKNCFYINSYHRITFSNNPASQHIGIHLVDYERDVVMKSFLVDEKEPNPSLQSSSRRNVSGISTFSRNQNDECLVVGFGSEILVYSTSSKTRDDSPIKVVKFKEMISSLFVLQDNFIFCCTSHIRRMKLEQKGFLKVHDISRDYEETFSKDLSFGNLSTPGVKVFETDEINKCVKLIVWGVQTKVLVVKGIRFCSSVELEDLRERMEFLRLEYDEVFQGVEKSFTFRVHIYGVLDLSVHKFLFL